MYDQGGGHVSKVVQIGLFDVKIHFLPILSYPHTTSVSLNLLLSEWYTTVPSLPCIFHVPILKVWSLRLMGEAMASDLGP